MSDAVCVDLEVERRASILRQRGPYSRARSTAERLEIMASLEREAQSPGGGWLASMPSDQLAVHLRRYGHTIRPGHRFAVKPDAREKTKARGRVHALFGREGWPGRLSILTMPGMNWLFEKQLLGEREDKAIRQGRRNEGFPRNTRIIAVEEDEAIYRASMKNAPGMDRVLLADEVPYATATWRTRMIHRYHRCTVETFAVADVRTLDAAWLDFTGPMTTRRMQAIGALWPRLASVLVVTALYARRPFVPPDLLPFLAGAELVDDYRYQDSSPMWQATYVRSGSAAGERTRGIVAKKNAPVSPSPTTEEGGTRGEV